MIYKSHVLQILPQLTKIVQAFSYGGNGNELFPSLPQKKFGGNESRYRQSAKKWQFVTAKSAKNGNSIPQI